jgi:A/G-specific adenine glycosylase
MPRAQVAHPLAQRLLAWYRAEARDLPWRETRDPYAILVSEVMLQQTRAETVVPYYSRFLRAYPTIGVLAAAPIDGVLKLWEGLGYYRRAHNLHRAAREILAHHDGVIPANRALLRELPGVGPYTAAAVASIAFGGDEPVVDGNVMRVLTRVFCVGELTSRASTRRALDDLARSLVPKGRAGDFNQALMDLGARVCLPRRPRCEACPIGQDCGAHRRGEQSLFPVRASRRPVPRRDVVAGVIWEQSREPSDPAARILLAQREADDMLGGLWEFPGGTVESGESYTDALRRELREELGIEVEVGPLLVTVEHSYSHFRMSLHAFHCCHTRGRPRPLGCAAFEWVGLLDVPRHAMSVADQKVARALAKERSARS